MKEPRLIELTELKPGYLENINNLLSQLSDSVHTITEEELNLCSPHPKVISMSWNPMDNSSV